MINELNARIIGIIKGEPLIKIYSHPRSGTHFIEKFVGLNFYPDKNLHHKPVEWGHWSNRKWNMDGNSYQKLFGTHSFPPSSLNKIKKGIYIYRDPRAVAYSIWKTDNFLNQKNKALTFSEFLQVKLDWKGSPAYKAEPQWNIAQHWEHHVTEWINYSYKNKNILVVSYEDLKLSPQKVYEKIARKFFPIKHFSSLIKLENKTEIKVVTEATGLLPNAATVSAWEKIFTKEDESFFLRQLKNEELINQYFASNSVY